MRVKYPLRLYVTAVRIKNCSKSTSVIKIATMKNTNGATHPSYRLKLKYLLPFTVSYVCSTRYAAVRIKNYLKSTSVIKVATMKSRDDFHCTKEVISCFFHHGQPPNQCCFTFSKDEWNTKEDTGKSFKNVLHILRYVKRHLSS